ncbi:MAG: hypothetical protein FWF71_03245 [Actinomycetia bacterium]|nr:hypothetical protein [Actinomycetes bacterium]
MAISPRKQRSTQNARHCGLDPQSFAPSLEGKIAAYDRNDGAWTLIGASLEHQVGVTFGGREVL